MAKKKKGFFAAIGEIVSPPPKKTSLGDIGIYGAGGCLAVALLLMLFVGGVSAIFVYTNLPSIVSVLVYGTIIFLVYKGVIGAIIASKGENPVAPVTENFTEK